MWIAHKAKCPPVGYDVKAGDRSRVIDAGRECQYGVRRIERYDMSTGFTNESVRTLVRVPVLPSDEALCVDAVGRRANTFGRVERNKCSIGATDKSVNPTTLKIVSAGDGSTRIDAGRNREKCFRADRT